MRFTVPPEAITDGEHLVTEGRSDLLAPGKFHHKPFMCADCLGAPEPAGSGARQCEARTRGIRFRMLLP